MNLNEFITEAKDIFPEEDIKNAIISSMKKRYTWQGRKIDTLKEEGFSADDLMKSHMALGQKINELQTYALSKEERVNRENKKRREERVAKKHNTL